MLTDRQQCVVRQDIEIVMVILDEAEEHAIGKFGQIDKCRVQEKSFGDFLL